MEIVIDKDKCIKQDTAVALGNFDGIHLGHKKLIETMVSLAKCSDLTPSVLTFDCDFNDFKLGKTHSSLVSKNQKEEILRSLGVELLYVVNFCEEIKNMEPEEFVSEIIVKKLRAKLVIVGFNFKFGHKAKGDTKILKKLSEKYNFKVEIISPVLNDQNIVSSTLIRNLISEGNIACANNMMGRRYSLEGTVERGMGRGHKLGFATANLKCDTDYVRPKYGVYESIVTYRDEKYKSITNVGANPTFEDIEFSIETHIIDFSKDIYGEKIEVELLEFLREEKKFESISALVEQVKSDILSVKSFQ